MCVSARNMLGPDPHEAKQPVPGRAEDLGAQDGEAACGPLTPEPCLGTAGGHSSWHWSKLGYSWVTPAA